MLVNKLLAILLLSAVAQARSNSDLGDVVICPGQAPVARFAYQIKSPGPTAMTLQEVYQKIAIINSDFSANLAAQDVDLAAKIRYRSVEHTNRDGETLGSCQLHQLYKIQTDLAGVRFAVINQNLFQALSVTEQNIFLTEIFIQLLNDKLLVTPEAAHDILKFQAALASNDKLTKKQWYGLLPKSWETCFIPIVEFGVQLCLGNDFDTQTMTGATLPYLDKQSITILNQKISFKQLNLKDSNIDFLFWGILDRYTDALWIQNSFVYPSIIYFNPKQEIVRIGTPEKIQSSIYCKTQKLLVYSAWLKFDVQSGCLTGSHYLNHKVLGEILDRAGQWHKVQDQDVNLDSEGYLVP